MSSDAATQGALVYILAYMFTTLGAFAVVMAIEKEDGSGGNIDDITGLARSRPLMAMAMTFFMLSLTGIPLTAGFVGKFMVFAAAVQAGLFGLAVIGVLTSVVSAFYYMRVVVNMYLRDSSGELLPALETPYVRWAINLSLAGTLVFGIFYPLAINLVEHGQHRLIYKPPPRVQTATTWSSSVTPAMLPLMADRSVNVSNRKLA